MKSKIIKRFAYALAATTILYPADAMAAVVPLGNFIITGLIGLGATSAVLLNPLVVGGIVLAGAQIGLSLLTGGAGAIDPGRAKEQITSSETSELNAIGTVKVGGALNYGNNDHPEIYRHLLHLRGPIDRVVTPYVNEREVIIDSSDRVLSPPWSDFAADGTVSANYLTLQSKIGDGTETAYSELVAAFPTIWTSAHKAQGIFQTLATITSPGTASAKYLKLFGSNPNPTVQHVVRASLLYNPESDSTHSNGSGTQRVDDASTWVWSDNGIVGVLNIFMQYPDFRDTLIDWDAQILEVQAADVVVDTKTGTEKRARASGIWPSESKRGDVFKQAMDSVGCEMVLSSEGKYYFKLIDDSPASQVAFTEDDIYKIDWQSGPKAIERPNVCEIKYYSPERDYEMAEIDLTGISWAVVQDEVDRWGEKVLLISLPFCPSASQAQRIARRIFLWARADAGTIVTNLSGMAAFGCNYASIEVIGDTETCKISAPRCNDQDGEVDIPFISLPTLAAWDSTTDEASAPTARSPQEDDTALATPAAPSSLFSVTYEDSAVELRIIYSSVADATGYLAAYSEINADGTREPYVPMTKYAGILVSYKAGDFAGDHLEAKIQAFNTDGSSNFSASLIDTSIAVNTDTPIGVTAPLPTQDYNGGTGVRTLIGTGVANSLNIIKMKIEVSLAATPTTFSTISDTKETPGDFAYTTTRFGTDFFETLKITQTVHGGATLVDTFDINP